MSEFNAIVDALTIECTRALFEHYGTSLEHVASTSAERIWAEDLCLAGVIGYTSRPVRGSLVLAVSERPLRKMSEDPGEHRDWIQELANQLLGRMKNRLLAYGVDLKMTTPLSLRGTHLVLDANGGASTPLLFRTNEGGAVAVLVDAEIEPGFQPTRADDAEVACLDEGTLLLF